MMAIVCNSHLCLQYLFPIIRMIVMTNRGAFHFSEKNNFIFSVFGPRKLSYISLIRIIISSVILVILVDGCLSAIKMCTAFIRMLICWVETF